MRRALFYLFLFILQGSLAPLLAPLPPPDLFLLAVLLLWRVAPWQLVLLAYGVGLLQDLIGNGSLGLHGLGLACGVFVAVLIRSQLSQKGLLERFLVVFGALVGKWAVFVVVLVWLEGASNFRRTLLGTALPEAALTLLLTPILFNLSHLLFERRDTLRKRLL